MDEMTTTWAPLNNSDLEVVETDGLMTLLASDGSTILASCGLRCDGSWDLYRADFVMQAESDEHARQWLILQALRAESPELFQ